MGDGDLKDHGVVAVPEVTHTILTPEDSCLVIASDGLWDRISSQAAVDLIRDTVKDPTMCAQRLATEAITLGSGGCHDCFRCVVPDSDAMQLENFGLHIPEVEVPKGGCACR